MGRDLPAHPPAVLKEGLTMIDVRVHDGGSVIGFEYVKSDRSQWLGNTLWVDHRMAEILSTALVVDGFEVEPWLEVEVLAIAEWPAGERGGDEGGKR
jgi:hypothetical protein